MEAIDEVIRYVKTARQQMLRALDVLEGNGQGRQVLTQSTLGALHVVCKAAQRPGSVIVRRHKIATILGLGDESGNDVPLWDVRDQWVKVQVESGEITYWRTTELADEFKGGETLFRIEW